MTSSSRAPVSTPLFAESARRPSREGIGSARLSVAVDESYRSERALAIAPVCLAEAEALGAANERARVALELHDGIIQGVLAVSLELHGLSARAAQTSPALATELTRLGDILRSETVLLRDMVQGLTPRELPPAQLIETLAAIVQRFQVDTGIRARFVTALDIIDLPPRACRELTRIVQEALVNVRKHSGARNVVVQLTAAGDACQLSIDDDGRGFPWTGRRAFDLEQAHLSLRSIRERVRVLAGQVTVESNPGRGARIEIPFPLGSHATN